MSRVAVVGTGYVGLTSAACFARLGHDVVAADLDADKVARLRKGEVPILEERLPALVAEGLEARRLRFVVGAADAVRGAEFVFLCVQTPQGPSGEADLSAVEAVVREVAPLLSPGAVVVTKSTVPVGTAKRIARWLSESGAPHEVGVASNPEFLREGTAVRDFLEPTRIVIGCEDPAVAVRVSDLYRDIAAPLVVTDAASAEMIKYASNVFLAMKISYINSMAVICEAVNADVKDVALGMGYDPRIGRDFLQPGPGYGGSCLPKDAAALLNTAAGVGYEFSLLRGVIEVNTRQHEHVVDKVRTAAGGELAGTKLAVWGLTYKANTDDLRDSPALAIATRLAGAGAEVHAYDPVAGEAARALAPGLTIAEDPYAVCTDADVLALLTEWDEFRWLDFGAIARSMRSPRIVDARNLLDAVELRRIGFNYQGIGR
ncbi:MAG TPA: UDP-glucose/GDP-mannose dehydrogenase family protein [Acidimicrobiia bacterium]|nr:UDP-glucose/GDP-mannose dehydrogenase family protein [Acidimicrobiia bacterium]